MTRQIRLFACSWATLLVVTLGNVPGVQGQVFRDDFNVSHDYFFGSVPASGIWSGVHNPTNGGGVFDANTTSAGQLRFGMQGAGWGNNDTGGRMLYRNVDAGQFREVRAKITSQTAGFWSTSGVIARLEAGPVDDGDFSDEYFVSAASFSVGGTGFGGGGASLQGQNIEAGIRVQELNTSGLTAADVAHVRLKHFGDGQFRLFASDDGANWYSFHSINRPELAAGNLQVGAYGSDNNGGLADSFNEFDWVEIVQGAPVTGAPSIWSRPGTATWNVLNNWDSPEVPNSNTAAAILGGGAKADSTVLMNDAITVKSLTFDNTHQYAIGGLGSLTLSADTGSASLEVLSGSHQILVDVAAGSDVDANAAASSSLQINAPVSLNGFAFNIAGDVQLNNGIDLGGGSLGLSSPLSMRGDAHLEDATLMLNFDVTQLLAPGESLILLAADRIFADGLRLDGVSADVLDWSSQGGSLSITYVPEPSMCLLGVCGMLIFLHGRRRFAKSCLLLLVGAFCVVPHVEAQVFRDDFDQFHDYSGFAGGTPGTVPAGGIWDGIHNPTNGGGGGFSAKFEANGTDFFGNPKTGLLHIEDLNAHENTDGQLGVGWEGGIANAPFLFKNVPVEKNFRAVIKIDDETPGFWSNTAIMARVAGPTPGRGRGDVIDDENFITAATFRIDANAPELASMIMQKVVDGAEVQESNVELFNPAPVPLWVQLVKEGTVFTGSMSLNGVDFLSSPDLVYSHDAFAPGTTMEVGLGHWRYTGGTPGSADIDYFELEVFDPPTSRTWNLDGNGDWNALTNWTGGSVPNANDLDTLFGGVITGPRTVYTNQGVTTRSLTFNNANRYVITGTGSITLASNTGTSSLTVVEGSHQIQVPLALGNNTSVSVGSGARLDLRNAVDLGGRTMAVAASGGQLNFNNNIVTGAAGQVDNQGRVGGTGTIHGALDNLSGGAVAPGLSAGTLSVTGDYSQAAGATLEIEIGGTGSGEFDLLAIGGTALLNGTLSVTLLDGFTPAPSSSFTVVTASSITNNGLTLSGPGAGSFSMTVSGNSVTLTALGGGAAGDFNGDGLWNCADLNALTAAIAGGSTDPAFDMNGDGSVTPADITSSGNGWLAVGGANNAGATGGNPFLSGDANLDGVVDVSDFNIWNGNKFTSVAAWCQGDFSADGAIDVSDFNIWNGNKFQSSSGVSAVPEPAVLAWWVVFWGVACGRSLRRCG